MLVELPLAHFQLRFSKPALYRSGHTEACAPIPRGGAGHLVRIVSRPEHAKFNS